MRDGAMEKGKYSRQREEGRDRRKWDGGRESFWYRTDKL